MTVDRPEPSPLLAIHRSEEGGVQILQLAGELDLSTRDVVSQLAVSQPWDSDIVLDLGDLTFMDCSGYGAIVGLTNSAALHQRSLTLRNEHGEPARLLGSLPAIKSAESGGTTPHETRSLG